MNAFATFMVILSVLASGIAAANTINIINHCPYDIWFWVVGPPKSELNGEDYDRIPVPRNNGSVLHHMINTEAFSGGLSLKFRDLPQYRSAPAGIVQVEYHLEPSLNNLWYDLSVIDCDINVGPENPRYCPFIRSGMTMHVTGAAAGLECPKAWCSNTGCTNTYMRSGSWLDEPSWNCHAGTDLVIETCTESAGPRTHDGKPTTNNSPASPLVVSPDGFCGVPSSYTCQGSRWGECCSAYGYCGSSAAYCGGGCQSAYGICSGQALVARRFS